MGQRQHKCTSTSGRNRHWEQREQRQSTNVHRPAVGTDIGSTESNGSTNVHRPAVGTDIGIAKRATVAQTYIDQRSEPTSALMKQPAGVQAEHITARQPLPFETVRRTECDARLQRRAETSDAQLEKLWSQEQATE